MLVEVLSPSTRDYDLGEKLQHYKTIPSLTDVIFIEPEVVDVLHVWRTARGWRTKRYTSLDQAPTLKALGAPLPLAEIYAATASA